MGAVAITIKPINNANHPIVDSKGVLQREEVQYRQSVVNSFQLITQDTTAGAATFHLPTAASLPNQEFRCIKISSDGNLFTVAVAVGSTDVINKLGAWGAASLAIGTAQGANARLCSDGMSNWYVL